MSQGGSLGSGGGGGGTVTSITSNNLEITNAAGPVVDIEDLRFTTQYVVDPSSALGQKGTFTTITAAVAAASGAGGGAVFVRAGTYAESFTLPAGVSLAAYNSVAPVFGGALNAVIDGTVTLTDAGQNTIQGICLSNTGAGAVLDLPGTNGMLVFINDCIFVGGSGPAFTGSNGNAHIELNNAFVVSTGSDYISLTGSQLTFTNSTFVSVAGPASALLASSQIQFRSCNLDGTISLSGTSQTSLDNSIAGAIVLADSSGAEISNSQIANNSGIAITTSATSAIDIRESIIASGNGFEAITIGGTSGVRITECSLNVTGAAFAVTGTGNLQYGLIEFPGSVSDLDPGLSINLFPVRPFATTSSRGLAFFNPADFTVSAAGEVSLLTPPTRFTWVHINSNQTLAVNTGYFTSGGNLSLALPATSVSGDEIRVVLDGGTSWTITQGAGQTIEYSNISTTAGAGGSLATTKNGDAIHMVCSIDNLAWRIVDMPIGNLTFT